MFFAFCRCGPAAFASLGTLFLMTWISTRPGYQRKLALGVAERRRRTGAWQVLANLAVSAGASVSFSATGNRVLAGRVSPRHLSEAACDTVASEIGQSPGTQALLITTWERVPAGVDGGITLIGSFTGLAAGSGDCGSWPWAE